ncbi:MAG: bifunctional hydroxymethylpyrimidine kinase/phosphomethylpyrimidine kinase [Actinomycetota bacterium]
MKRVMSVATSDSGAGAGIQADLKAFLRCGVYGTTAIVATTAQNTVAVTDIYPFPPEVGVRQIEAIVEDIGADAVKTGMLFNAGIISAVAGAVQRLRLPNLVVDPVMVAESGARLLEPDAVETYKAELFPLAKVITPNVNEAFALLDEEVDEDRIEDCAVTLRGLGPEAVIITGGHTESGADLLYDGERFARIEGPVHPSENTHGAGCTHSSALASFLARGYPLEEAAREARSVASDAVRFGLSEIGAGAGPVHALGPVLQRAGIGGRA